MKYVNWLTVLAMNILIANIENFVFSTLKVTGIVYLSNTVYGKYHVIARSSCNVPLFSYVIWRKNSSSMLT